MERLISSLPLLIIAYSVLMLFQNYTDKEEEILGAKSSLEQASIRVEKLKKRMTNIDKFKKNIDIQREKVKGVVAEIENIQKKLPTTVNATQIEEDLYRMSTDLKIKEVSIRNNPEKLNDFYYEKTYEFRAQGTFLQGLVLLEQISKQDRILNVRMIEILNSSPGDKGKYEVLDLKFVLESYRYNSTHNEGAELSSGKVI